MRRILKLSEVGRLLIILKELATIIDFEWVSFVMQCCALFSLEPGTLFLFGKGNASNTDNLNLRRSD